MTATNVNLTAASSSSTNALRDIKPPVVIANPWFWVWCGLGLLLVAAVLYWTWKRSQRKAAAAPEPVVPAHIRAKQRLREALALIGQPKEFCIAVSDTARWYLEERFDFHAPERTTEEFLYELQATDLLTRDQKDSLSEFLNRCDLVKFAKYEPREPELHDLHDAALRLVEETEPVTPLPGDAPTAQAPATEPVTK